MISFPGITRGRMNVRLRSIPLTATSETTRSAALRVSLVASTGPFSSLTVEEIDRAVTELGAAVTKRDRTTGARRAVDMVDE